MYVPSNLWPEISEKMKIMLNEIKIGDVHDFGNFMNAVIDENSFDNIMNYINIVKNSDKAEIFFGGKGDKTNGYYVDPTVVVTKDPNSITMEEEIFGPVLTVYIYDSEKFDEVLELCDSTSPYALTGAIFARDREVIVKAENKLKDAAGNFYINDKPTGAVVGQQPFGGARGSGTNDKAGAVFNLLRWASPRTIKETFCPPSDYKYPFMS
jgi:1-pyrroline-5-carboxylate dehydrogenase